MVGCDAEALSETIKEVLIPRWQEWGEFVSWCRKGIEPSSLRVQTPTFYHIDKYRQSSGLVIEWWVNSLSLLLWDTSVSSAHKYCLMQPTSDSDVDIDLTKLLFLHQIHGWLPGDSPHEQNICCVGLLYLHHHREVSNGEDWGHDRAQQSRFVWEH